MTLWQWIDEYIGGLFRFMDRYSISRRVTLLGSVWATYDSYTWAKHFAEVSPRTGMEVTAIIAAVLASVTALQGWVLKLYNESKETVDLPPAPPS